MEIDLNMRTNIISPDIWSDLWTCISPHSILQCLQADQANTAPQKSLLAYWVAVKGSGPQTERVSSQKPGMQGKYK